MTITVGQIFYEYAVFASVFFGACTSIELFLYGLPFNEKRRPHVWKQMCHSLSSLWVMVTVNIVWWNTIDPMLAYDRYYDTHEYTTSMMIKNVLWFFVIYETAFYWIHYILHTRRPINLYRLFHKEHHHRQVTQWSGVAFSALEASFNVINLHLVKLIVPVPPSVHYSMLLFAVVADIVAHDDRLDIFDHVSHHTKNNCNYGGYLPIWDWIMGTRECDLVKSSEN